MKKKSWKHIPEGGLIIEPGNSINFKTGNWKTYKPVWNKDKCINCMTCFISCPEDAIKVVKGKITAPDLDFCKGCGICAQVCPAKALTMVKDENGN